MPIRKQLHGPCGVSHCFLATLAGGSTPSSLLVCSILRREMQAAARFGLRTGVKQAGVPYLRNSTHVSLRAPSRLLRTKNVQALPNDDIERLFSKHGHQGPNGVWQLDEAQAQALLADYKVCSRSAALGRQRLPEGCPRRAMQASCLSALQASLQQKPSPAPAPAKPLSWEDDAQQGWAIFSKQVRERMEAWA